MAEACKLGMVVPQEQAKEEEDDASDNIGALFGDDNDVSIPATTDEQVALLVLFETAHRKEVMRQFMAAEREALVAMLVVRVSAVREATRTAAEEEAVWEAARMAEEATIATTEATATEEVARE
jgi:hypothetical protein